MIKLKKFTGVILCGAITALLPMCLQASAADAPNIDTSISNIISVPKNDRFGVFYKYDYSDSKTAATNYTKAVYDFYFKYDTAGFDTSSGIIKDSRGYIESVSARIYNNDGSYIGAKIDGFEQGQYNACTFSFPKNGLYKCTAKSSYGYTHEFELDVEEVAVSYDDGEAPVISVTRGKSDDSYVNITIDTDEICDIKINGKTYSNCTGIDYKITANGSYTITATDKYGHKSEKTITINSIGGSGQDNIPIEKPELPVIQKGDLGDVNLDGIIDSSDASDVLGEYARLQTGKPSEFDDGQNQAADVNKDGVIDSSDASKILAYYAASSTGRVPSWD